MGGDRHCGRPSCSSNSSASTSAQAPSRNNTAPDPSRGLAGHDQPLIGVGAGAHRHAPILGLDSHRIRPRRADAYSHDRVGYPCRSRTSCPCQPFAAVRRRSYDVAE